MEKFYYKDSMNFAPIDVIKGIDLITKKLVLAEDEVPKGIGHERVPKCKYCKNFETTVGESSTGICKASLPMPYKAYAEMRATTCDEFHAL